MVRSSLAMSVLTMVMVSLLPAGPIAAQVVTLTPIPTTFNGIIGIDHHQPTNKVVVSVNYPTGLPYNFELVSSTGSRTQFSAISGLTDEVKIATARDTLGGFAVGEMFTGTGVPGEIIRISATGASSYVITLPGEPGLMRGSMHVDRTGVFGGDLIVVTTAGNVWRVKSSAPAGACSPLDCTQLTGVGTHLEGVCTIPNNAAKYGPWTGKILAGAEGQGRVYAIAPDGTTTFYTLGINPEDIDIIPTNENFFGVGYGDNTLYGAPPSEFAGMVGDVLITQEGPGKLFRVNWNGSVFETTQLAQVTQWEHVAFSPAGIIVVPPSAVPTVSAWGLVVLTLLLLTGTKVYFARRQTATA